MVRFKFLYSLYNWLFFLTIILEQKSLAIYRFETSRELYNFDFLIIKSNYKNFLSKIEIKWLKSKFSEKIKNNKETKTFFNVRLKIFCELRLWLKTIVWKNRHNHDGSFSFWDFPKTEVFQFEKFKHSSIRFSQPP